MSNIFIYGIENSLAACCLDHWLRVPGVDLWYVGSTLGQSELVDRISRAMSQTAGETGEAIPREEISCRLHPLGPDVNAHTLAPLASAGVDEAWSFTSVYPQAPDKALLERFLGACATISVKEANCVVFDDAPERVQDREMAKECERLGLSYRVFRTALILGSGDPDLDHSEALSGFLAALCSFKNEIEERSPQYFDFQALRCIAPADATVNIVPARVASEWLLRMVRNRTKKNRSCALFNSKNTSFQALYEQISAAYGLSILPVNDFQQLNAVDRAFHERTRALRESLTHAPAEPDKKACAAAGTLLELAAFGDEERMEALESLQRSQDRARAEREGRVAEVVATLEKKLLARDGLELNYYVAGTAGPTIVLLNALGQGIEFWHRLISRLVERNRVIVWEPRGTEALAPFGLSDQVDDLDAVLRNEALDACHLAGWCTGPKVAIEFYLRRPSAVQSMTFLNGTFKCDGSPQELDTAYEKNLEFLCRRLVVKPAMATSIMQTFQTATEVKEANALNEDEMDREQMGEQAVSAVSPRLKPWVLAPFRNEDTTRNYARQLIDFWSHDVRPKARQVDAPVLLISSEYDQIVASTMSRMAAELFPNCRHVHVPAATHYCFYDRPDLIASLMQTFVDESNDKLVAAQMEDTAVTTCIEGRSAPLRVPLTSF